MEGHQKMSDIVTIILSSMIGVFIGTTIGAFIWK
jgi:hypothetical protein